MGDSGGGDPPHPKAAILLGGEDDVEIDEDLPSQQQQPRQQPGPSGSSGLSLLLNQIIMPSPYPQHNSGPTSSRFRNALNRVLQQPDKDVEAWQALLTEVNTCYKNIPNVHAADVETQNKLDWIESCYGHFFRYFPYSPTQAVTVVEMLLKQSARVGEENGPLVDYYYGGDGSGKNKVPKRALMCEQKLQGVLQEWLGIANFETGEMATLAAPHEKAATNGEEEKPQHRATGICSWVVELWLLFVKKTTRDAMRAAEVESQAMEQRTLHTREATKQAFELALSHCGFGHNNHLIWVSYLDFVKGWNKDSELTPGTSEHAAATQQQMMQLRSIYQRLVTHPMTGLDQLWHEYEAWERNQSEALAVAFNQEFSPKYQHARTVYLERNRVYNKETELQMGQRLAVPPVRREDGKDKDEYVGQMSEELRLTTAWKKRCSYERTNPERVSNSELVVRIRTSYKEMVCVLARHPETWQMWATYELFRNAGGSASSAEVATPGEAVSVLQLGQEMIPSSILLVYEEARIVELYGQQLYEKGGGSSCLRVMERALERFPTTLGFVLYQQMVRRYKGIRDARAVFGRARRVLVGPGDSSMGNGVTGERGEEGDTPGDGTETDPTGMEAMDTTSSQSVEVAPKERWLATNKLDPLIGAPSSQSKKTQQDTSIVGRITWHLYAAHASMEHRMNRSPEIASRVYELGLRRHKHFLTKATYVMQYAELLLELADTMNLRALMTRAVAACQASSAPSSSLVPLWDMALRFEMICSGADPACLGNVGTIERQRRETMYGPDLEDVATGGFVGASDTALIGAQKSSIAEQLVRAEGYDLSSNIVSGLGRTVDVLQVMGLWGSGKFKSTIRKKTHEATDAATDSEDMPGGESDSSYQLRLEFANMIASGDDDGEGLGGGSRSLTARQRMQQQTVGGGAGPTTAIMLAIQQMPDWIRPLLFLLPASQLRLPVVAKPPPHLVEIALNTLLQNQLPAKRPSDKLESGNNAKRKANDDSSDDEDGTGTSGFGNAFRARQRARLSDLVAGS